MTLPDVNSSNHIHFRIGLALIMVGLVGCASTSAPEASYVPEALKWSEVPPAAPQPIDGEWKTEGGLIDNYEKGRGRKLNSAAFDRLDVVYKNIQKVEPGKYALEVISFSRHSRKTGYSKAEIEIISPTEIVFRAHPNQTTGWGGGKQILTIVRLDNESSFLQEIKDMGMVVDSEVWKKAQKSRSVSAYEKSIREYPILFFTEIGEEGISNMKTVFTEQESFTINVHIKPCVKSKWHVSISRKNGSEEFKAGLTQEVSYHRTHTKGTGANCVSETILGSSSLRNLTPGLYTATLVIGEADKRSIDFTVAPK